MVQTADMYGRARGPTVATLCFGISLALGVLSLLGWGVASRGLSGFGFPNYPDWPLAAAANCAIAAALLSARRGPAVRLALLSVSAVIGGLALLEYLFRVNVGIDSLLFHDEIDRVALAYPGRPGLVPTVSILAMSFAAWLAGRKAGRRNDEIVFLLASVIIGLAAMSAALLLLGTDLARQSTRLAASLPASLATLAQAAGLLANLKREGRAFLWSGEDKTRGVAKLALPIILVMPAILLPLELRAAEAGLASPLTAEIIASAINLLIIVGLLSWSIERLTKEHQALLGVTQSLDVVPVALVRESGQIVRWSAGCTRLLGWTEAEAVGRDVNDLLGAGLTSEMLGSSGERQHVGKELALTARDGGATSVLVDARRIELSDGPMTALAFTDIGERLLAEKALRAGEAQLRSIVETVPDAMVIIDEAGIMHNFSAAAERIFGYTSSEVVGRNVSMLMPAVRAKAHDGYLANYIATGERHVIGNTRRMTARRADGTEIPIELSVGEAWSGGRRMFTGFIRDISSQIAAEERMDHLRAEYAHSARLSAMGEMAAALAHELNQPLAAGANFLGTAQLLLAQIENGEVVAEMVGLSQSQFIRAGDIIRRLRDFVAKRDTDLSREALPQMVHEAAALGLIGANQYHVDLEYDLAPDAEQVMADRIQVQQVLVNLLRNAAEAVRSGPVHQRQIRISSSVIDEDFVEVAVTDEGPGLPEAVMANLYAPFLTTKSSEGMGIGLSICRRIIEAHGGTFRATNRKSRGARLSFTLRRYQAGRAEE